MPRYVLLAFALLLSACGATPGSSTTTTPTTPPPSTNSPLTRLSGQIVNWPGGSATLAMIRPRQTFARTTVSADGRFTLDLPDAQTIAPDLVPFSPPADMTCSNAVFISDPALRVSIWPGFSVDRDGTHLGAAGRGYGLTRFDEAKPGDYLVRWYFASLDARITGTLKCASFKATYDLPLKAGWNVVRQEYTTNYVQGQYYEERWSLGGDENGLWGFQAAK